MYMTTPELSLDDVHAEKYVKTSKYTYSGDVEKDYYIEYYYNITQNKALDPTMNYDVQLFDKNMKLLDESKGYIYSDIHENDYLISVTPDIFKKVDTIQLTFNEGGNLVLFNATIKVTKSDEKVIEIDDTPEKHSKNTGRSYPTEDMYQNSEEPDWYWGTDELGHRVHKPKHPFEL